MEVEHDRKGREFRVVTPAGRAVLQYSVKGGVLDVFHTFVPEAERGKGIAGSMAKACMAFVAGEGLRVHASCSYMERFLEEHEEYAEYVSR